MGGALARGRPSVGAFVALTLVAAAPFWVLGAAVKPPPGSPVALPLSALQFVAPGVAAGILVYREGGLRGVRGLLVSLGQVPRGRRRRWVGMAVVPLVVYGLAAVILVAIRPGVSLPPPDPGVIVVLVAIFLVAAAAEELGWTAYALDPLVRRWGAPVAGLVLGAVWAVFHLVPDLQGGHDAAWIALHRWSATALRVMIVASVVGSGGGAVAVLVHAMDNVGWTVLLGDAYDPAVVAPLMTIAAVLTLIALRRAGRAAPLLDRGPWAAA